MHEALIKAVAERIDAAIPDSAIRQLAENEYQAKLHEIQLKVSSEPSSPPCIISCTFSQQLDTNMRQRSIVKLF